jgi:hypothetical protein
MNELLKFGMAWLIYLFGQVFLFNHLVIFHVVVPFVFLTFLLVLPFDLRRSILYPVAFITGLLVDILSENMATGLHAFCCVLVVALRPYVLSSISSSNVRNSNELSLRNQNTLWLTSYLLLLFFVYHLAYYLLEAFTFANFLTMLLKVMGGTVFTFVWGVSIAYVFYKR